MSLEWTRIHPDATGARTKCGRYSVCFIRTDRGESWEAWKLVPGGVWFAPLALGLESESVAKQVAETDRESAIL